MRTCKICHQKKELKDFYKTNEYTRWICRRCENKRMMLWRVKKARELKLKAIEYLGGRCKKCGYNNCVYALEFNHIKEKKYEPTKMFYKIANWNRIKTELNKCELLCANCHREFTFATVNRLRKPC